MTIQPVTHFLKFADEATAKAALPSYWATTITGWSWNRTKVAGPLLISSKTNTVSVTDKLGTRTVPALCTGYFLNIVENQLISDMPGLLAAGYGDANDFTLLVGVSPVTPQHVFFGC